MKESKQLETKNKKIETAIQKADDIVKEYPFLFEACSCHFQDYSSIDIRSQYSPHIDKLLL